MSKFIELTGGYGDKMLIGVGHITVVKLHYVKEPSTKCLVCLTGGDAMAVREGMEEIQKLLAGAPEPERQPEKPTKEYKAQMKCHECKGRGYIRHGGDLEYCVECNGTGYLS